LNRGFCNTRHEKTIMVKQLISAIALIIFLGSCSSLKPLNFSGSKPVATQAAPAPVKFIDEITAASPEIKPEQKPVIKEVAKKAIVKEIPKPQPDILEMRAEEKNVSELQLKYGELLETEADQLQNINLLENIDDWYGTRYRYGGTTKKGIDCSAFVEVIYASVFSVTLPRTAREQYRVTEHISRTELEEGDLLFFNTRGGVSHVGIYLQNNKFVHASSTNGVTVSDMFDPYYLKKFIGAGRVKGKSDSIALQ